ncbi:hypothetical protein HPB48_005865 [Haemaphysalis longicornis]|uniref:Uncharacterized protein n=1 Tax=Haemaphysalis longicornis TaxID=44386 RepID=A0A9J6GDZ7_HAELO|nr:hypothetical protein HPB48_005865 [Haemaphysalis longicornis]
MDARRNPSGVGSSRKPSTSAYTTVADTTSKRFDASKLRASVDWGKTTLHTATESGAPSKGRSSEKKRKSKKAGEESTRSMRSSRSGAKGRKASTGSYWKFWQRNASVDKGKEKAKAGFDASKLKASMDWGKSTVYSAAESMGPSKGPSSDKKGKPKKAADEATRSVRSSRSGAKVRKADTSSSKTNGKRLTREPSKSATAPQRVDL